MEFEQSWLILNIPSMSVYGIFMIFNLQFYETHKSDQLEKIIATRVRIVRRYGASFEFVELKL